MPPKKAASKSKNLNPTDTKENRAKLLNDKLAKIDQDIATNGTLDPDEALMAIYLAFFSQDSMYNVKEMFKKVNRMEESLSVQDNYITNIEAKITTLEIESHQTKIILRNVPLEDEKDNRENYNSTRSTVEDLLSFSDLKLDSITDFYRLFHKRESTSNPSKKLKVDGKQPPIFVSFTNIHALKAFTQKLADMKKNKKYEKMVMEYSCPPSLKPQHESANKEAFRLRSEKNLVTRVRITKNGIKLLARTREETKFTEVTIPKKN